MELCHNGAETSGAEKEGTVQVKTIFFYRLKPLGIRDEISSVKTD